MSLRIAIIASISESLELDQQLYIAISVQLDNKHNKLTAPESIGAFGEGPRGGPFCKKVIPCYSETLTISLPNPPLA